MVVTAGTVVVTTGVVVDVVVVVVAGGMTNPFAQPHLMSVGAPTGNPTVDVCASRYLRSCDQPSHADTPVVGHPPVTWLQADVCTVMDAILNGMPICTARAASTAH